MSEPVNAARTPLTNRDISQFDIEDHEYVQDIYNVFAEMNAHAPVTWAHTHGGHWVVTGYEAVRESANDWRTFSSEYGAMWPMIGEPDTPPITNDPPVQQLYRKLLTPFFTPKAAERLEPAAREHAHAIIDSFITDGHADLSGQFAEVYIPLVFYRDVVHVPEHLIDEFMHRTVVPGATPRDHSRILAELAIEFVEARWAAPPVGDVVDALINGELDGVPFTKKDVIKVATIVLIGGTDTTRNVITTALWHLAQNPDLRSQLIADPGLMPQAVEEYLRLFGSVQLVGRTVMQDATVGPARMCPGQKVVMSPAAANRDPARFPDPTRFDLFRSPNPHLAFGVGVHRCLGSNLARMEIKVAIEAVLERLPDYRIVEDQAYERRSGHIHGPEHVPVTFPPGRPR